MASKTKQNTKVIEKEMRPEAESEERSIRGRWSKGTDLQLQDK